jgi:DNA-binding response OmpR family regulator
VPSRSADLSFSAVLERGGRTIELLQRPGGGIARADSVAIEFARLEFALIAILAEARQRLSDPDLCFVSAPTLAEKLSFNSDYADGDNVRELVRRVRRKVRDAGLEDLIESRQRVGYRLAWQVAGRR